LDVWIERRTDAGHSFNPLNPLHRSIGREAATQRCRPALSDTYCLTAQAKKGFL